MQEISFMIDKERKQRLDETMRFSLKNWQELADKKMEAANKSHKVEQTKRKCTLIAQIFNKETYKRLIKELKIKSHTKI